MTQKEADVQQRIRTVTWEDPSIGFEVVKSRTGLESLNALKRGEISNPPFIQLLGIKLLEVEVGRVVFGLKPAEYHFGWGKTLQGGAICTLLDAAMTHAVHSTLSAEFECTTLEIKTNFVRAITAQSGALRCEGRVLHTGRRIATAEGRLIDLHEKLYAHGTATCMVFSLK
jgi:uncharacterized protein (TIGR00369 family)